MSEFDIFIGKTYPDGTYVLKDLLDKNVFIRQHESSTGEPIIQEDFVTLAYDADWKGLVNGNTGVWRAEKEEIEQIQLIYQNQLLQKVYFSSGKDNPYAHFENYLFYEYYPDTAHAEQAMKQNMTAMMNQFLETLKSDFSNERICYVFVNFGFEDYISDILFFLCTEKARAAETKYKEDIRSYAKEIPLAIENEQEHFLCALNFFLEHKHLWYNMKKFLSFMPFIREYIHQHIREYVPVTEDFKVQAYPVTDGETICGVDENGAFQYLFDFN